jgi:hypothetical protein
LNSSVVPVNLQNGPPLQFFTSSLHHTFVDCVTINNTRANI